MDVRPISMTNFKGDLTLKNTNLPEGTYNQIYDFTQAADANVTIMKCKENKHLPSTDMYSTVITKGVKKKSLFGKKTPMVLHGTSVALVSKNADQLEVSNAIFTSFLDAAKKLGIKITEKTGKAPEYFLKLVNR